jgi:hypothetical protein
LHLSRHPTAAQNAATPQLFTGRYDQRSGCGACATANTSAFVPRLAVIEAATTANAPQSLNSALWRLGLSQADIANVDRLASARKGRNPTTWSVLVHQLEVLVETSKNEQSPRQ